MGISRVINRRSAVLGLLLVILATAGFGFAAGNTIDPSSAGDGSEQISGYTITEIEYEIDPNHANIDEVSFLLTADNASTELADHVEVKLVASSNTWNNCTPAGAALPTTYTCDVDVTVLAADEFRVVSAE